ncbi:hypothetical protein M6B38_142790 [Iris pallida]|uniref:Uncharacterized protein n=1 Tax=Iris pallida TaxID=29817 RepID=A0AAX6FBL1_IRIPA|nr:hypothetical protein M6B38_142790 [Iris pallida]
MDPDGGEGDEPSSFSGGIH